MVVADVARGDSADYSAFHVFEIESCTQVAEYKGKISPKDFGNVLVGIASEYNEALLVCENANIGWATIEQILEREYRNVYYSSTSNMETVESYMNKYERDKLVPGFTIRPSGCGAAPNSHARRGGRCCRGCRRGSAPPRGVRAGSSSRDSLRHYQRRPQPRAAPRGPSLPAPWRT
mgnify:CR=1 FL=1